MNTFNFYRVSIAVICFVISLSIVAFIMYTNSKYSSYIRPFSAYTLLASSWEKYKIQFINNDGRVIDYSRNSITTSEGQSYALLRSVWIDDKETFDKVLQWTNTNLKRNNSHLYGWEWGRNSRDTYGLLPNGGSNTASDADSDTALALILASRRWNNNAYLDIAKQMLPEIWDSETVTIHSKRYLIAGNWAKNSSEVVINPSYFSPYAWRIFAEVDSKHDWSSLISPAYELLNTVGKAPLDVQQGSGLPPDWVSIVPETNTIKPSSFSGASTNYSYDALRVPWRIALDYQWSKDPRAKAYLESAFLPLINSYKKNGTLGAAYKHNGELLHSQESPAMYATAIAVFMQIDTSAAKQMYQDKILGLYSNDTNSFNKNLPYYEQNWLWFGMALYNNYLVPFT